MMKFRRSVLLAVAAPIFALILLAGYKHYILNSGIEITLPISGYDPRDLLSGHYLTYQVDYGVSPMCPEASSASRDGYVCLTSKSFSYDEPTDCLTFIRGTCRYTRFDAGVEKFYIPEDRAVELDRDVRDHKASIVLSVTGSGVAQVKELLIDGKSWKQP